MRKVFDSPGLSGREPLCLVVEIPAGGAVVNFELLLVVVEGVLDLHVGYGVVGGLAEEQGGAVDYGHFCGVGVFKY